MSGKAKFIAVGENIHCTRIYKVGGKFVKIEGGSEVIFYEEKGKERYLPIPKRFVESENWATGKVKHAAVAIWQGLYGSEEEKRASIAYLHYLTRRQESCGASYLDLNVDEFSSDSEERIAAMRWAAGVIQEASTAPLSIDSSNLALIKAGLERCQKTKGRPMVNSVSLDRQGAITEAAKAGAVVIAGAGGESSMPGNKAERIQNIKSLIPKLTAAGFAYDQIFLDPLVFPVSVDPNNGMMILEAIKELREFYGPEIHFAPGLSNISYGMPNRKLLNQVFTYLCLENGLDGGIVDPLQINEDIVSRMDTTAEPFMLAKAVFTGQDQFGMNYIGAARAGKL